MSIESLREQLKHAYYQRPKGESLEDRVAHILDRLKEDPHYEKCSEDELLGIAASMYTNGIIENLTVQLEGYVTATGKPMDPVWGQFTYDEILGMANDGVMVPQEFLDWANAMADTDTTSYEIEESASSDSNTASNLEVGTDDTTRVGQQRKLQKFSSKAEQQEELLREKNDELQAQGQDLAVIQSDLEQNQKLTLDKINKISDEFNKLNDKVKNGEPLTDDEMRRYRELGLLLNTQGEELIAQSNNVAADIETLLTQMDDVNKLVEVNKDISRTLENLSLLYSAAEGGKTHSYSYGASNGLNTFGVMEAYSYAAQSMSIASNSGVIGVELDLNSNNLQFKANSNEEIANTTLARVQALEAQGEEINPDQNTTTRIAENQASPLENEEQQDGVNDETEVRAEENNTPETEEVQTAITGAAAPTGEQDESITPEQDETFAQQPDELETAGNQMQPSAQTVAERVFNSVQTGNVTEEEAAQVVDNIQPQDDTQTNNVPQTTGVTQSAGTAASAEGAETVGDIEAADETTEVENTASETGTTADEAMDPEEAAVREYLTGCTSKSTEMQTITDSLTGLRDQVKDLRKSRLRDTIKTAAEFNKAFDRYESLLARVRTGNEISEADQAEYERLNGVLDAQTGSLSVDMQNKINILNEFSSAVESGLLLSSENLTYANTAIEAGKAYALENNEGSQEKIKLFAGKDGLYDRLYGKEGESVGRDVIESGEALASQTKSARRLLVFSSSLNGFASQYSSQLTENMNENNAKVAPLAQEFQRIFASKAEEENPQTAAGTNTVTQEGETIPPEAETTPAETGTTPETLVLGVEPEVQPEQNGEIQPDIEYAADNINVVSPAEPETDEQLPENNNNVVQSPDNREVQIRQSQAGVRSITNENTTVNAQVNGLNTQVQEETDVINTAARAESSDLTPPRSMNSASEFSRSRNAANVVDNSETDVEENIAALGDISQQSLQIAAGAVDSTAGINAFNNIPAETEPENAAATPEPEEGSQPDIQNINAETPDNTDIEAGLQNDIAEGIELAGQITTEAEAVDALAQEGQATGAAVDVEDEVNTTATRAMEAGSEVEADSGIAELEEAESEAVSTAGTEAVREIDASTAESSMPALNTPEDVEILQNTRGTVATGVEDVAEELSEQVEEQMADELAKSASQKNTESIVEDLVKEAGQQTIREYGGRLQQKDSKEDNKKKILMQFERKKRDAIKRGIEEVKKSMNAK